VIVQSGCAERVIAQGVLLIDIVGELDAQRIHQKVQVGVADTVDLRLGRGRSTVLGPVEEPGFAALLAEKDVASRHRVLPRDHQLRFHQVLQQFDFEVPARPGVVMAVSLAVTALVGVTIRTWSPRS
jgi:hypothetical protein